MNGRLTEISVRAAMNPSPRESAGATGLPLCLFRYNDQLQALRPAQNHDGNL